MPTNPDLYAQGFNNFLYRITSPDPMASNYSGVTTGVGGITQTDIQSNSLFNPINDNTTSQSINAGSLDSILFSKKTSFTDTTQGWRQGVDRDGVYKWIIGGATQSIDWSVTTPGVLTINGSITATTGTIGGFTINATNLTASAGGNSTILSSGSTALTIGPTGSPTFTVTQAGALTATSGTIGGFTLAATTLSATNLTLTSGAANTANIFVGTGSNVAGLNSGNAAGDIAMWAGASFANRATAPFRVTMAGNVTGVSNFTLTNAVLGASATSGEAITAGAAVYIKASDGRLYNAIGTGDESTYSFVGIALTTVGAAGSSVNYAPIGTIANVGLTLTAGSYYFITDVAGTIGTTPGTRYARIGHALTTTTLQVLDPKFYASGIITMSAIATGATSTVTTGFYPTDITFYATGTDTKKFSVSIGNQTGCVFNDTFLGTWISSTAYVYDLRDNAGTSEWSGTITRSGTGFVLTHTVIVGAGTLTGHVQWEATNV
jgi:hypothetical protein